MRVGLAVERRVETVRLQRTIRRDAEGRHAQATATFSDLDRRAFTETVGNSRRAASVIRLSFALTSRARANARGKHG